MEKIVPRKIELLVPARNLETGIAAIDHGADAVYIGAAQFGARQAAGNSVDDISALVNYAHIFGVKVYITLNTILTDEEIAPAEALITRLYEVGVDALIVQDMGITRMNIPPISLHCSTQMDNRTVEKTRFLSQLGFPRIVLARELTLQQIREIHRAVPDVELEVFVHGALCVSYSGRCYASQHCFGRSANRGACAQFCRLPFSLADNDGNTICSDKYLLSLKDMNRSAALRDLLDAGAVSLKIEGRLKDVSYVKNITAYYRKQLDEIFATDSRYIRSSYGKTSPCFVPNPAKSFNRGFTQYMLNGTRDGVTSPDTPKSVGEYMGKVKIVSRNFFTVDGAGFSNGDGACFFTRDGKLAGFHINKVENGRIFPQNMPPLYSGAEIYRNHDCEFERLLSRPSVPRRLSLSLQFASTDDGFSLTATAENGVQCKVEKQFGKQPARTPQRDNIVAQLSKWGNTPFEAVSVDVLSDTGYFVPSSLLSDMRRSLCDELIAAIRHSHERETMPPINDNVAAPFAALDYTGNVSNRLALNFYASHGVKDVAPAFEIAPRQGVPLMYCKHCIKYAMGWCSKNGVTHKFKEPFYLVAGDGRRFRLAFNCKECLMTVIADE